MRVRLYALYTLLGALALGIGVWVAQTRYAPTANSNQVPSSMWTMSLPDTAGQHQSLAQWRGKTLVLNFWATWCAPCREEIPDLVAIRNQYAAKSVEIVGIAIDNAHAVRPYARDMKINYPIVIGEGAALDLARALGNPSGALPYTVAIAPDGTILMRHLGRLPKAKLQAILDRPPAR
ncbi:MAG: TlpA family protein disulfide reductase [Thiobacillus sp.]